MSDGDSTSSNSQLPHLSQAYERAIDESIISSVTDLNGVIVRVNEKFCETSKYSAAELLGQNHRIINSSWHSKEFFQTMWLTISKGNVWHDAVRNRAKDGTFYWLDTVIVPVRDAALRATHYLSLRTLITERKNLEKQAEKNKSTLEALLVMTSDKVKRPILNCLRQITRLDSGPVSPTVMTHTMTDLKVSMRELEAQMRDLTTHLRDMKVT